MSTTIKKINMQRSSKLFKKKWKHYEFQVTKMYLLYFKRKAHTCNPDGRIVLSSINKLKTDHIKGASFPLQIHFKGKPQKGAASPWVLNLDSSDERIEWMDVIKQNSRAEVIDSFFDHYSLDPISKNAQKIKTKQSQKFKPPLSDRPLSPKPGDNERSPPQLDIKVSDEAKCTSNETYYEEIEPYYTPLVNPEPDYITMYDVPVPKDQHKTYEKVGCYTPPLQIDDFQTSTFGCMETTTLKKSLTDEDGGKEYEYRLKAPATDKHSSLSTSQFQDQHVSQLLLMLTEKGKKSASSY